MRFRRIPLLALTAITAFSAVHAQQVDTTKFPPDPASTPRVRLPMNEADTGFAAWRRTPQPAHKTAAGWTLRAGDWDLLVATPRAMDAMDQSHIIDTTLADCRQMLAINAADSAKVVNGRPWAPFDSVVHGRPVLVISIMPVLHNFTECGWKNLGRPAMIRRGLRFVTSYQYEAVRDPRSAVLVVRGRIVTPVMLATVPVGVVAGGGTANMKETNQLRLYVPFESIAPLANGNMPDVTLLIWNRADEKPEQIIVPANILHTVWWDNLYWRAAQLPKVVASNARAFPKAMLPVPAPNDTGLKTALRLQRAGRDAEAVNSALLRLNIGQNVSTNDRRVGLMTVAETFQANGDMTSAALVADELTSMDPCAISSTTAVSSKRAATGNPAGDERLSEVGALFDRARPNVRCTSQYPGTTFLRGLIPGYGQFTTWSKLIGLGVGTVIVAGAVIAHNKKTQADALYVTYVNEKSGHASQYYLAATNRKHDAVLVGTVTAALWIATAIEAEVQERVHASRLAAVREFWLRPLIAPVSAANGSLGVSGGLQLRFR